MASKRPQYEPGRWCEVDAFLSPEERVFTYRHRGRTQPDAWDQSRLLELLGLINYRILTGHRVYFQLGGVVYKTLYGGYWRSVFTGIEHYLLRCEAVSHIWTEDGREVVDLPIVYSREGWTVGGQSLSFVLYLE
jgi:hypothetical protein